MEVRSRSSAPPLVEILVHTSGPSGARDDCRYRAQAAAYLLFKPQRSDSLLAAEEQVAGDAAAAAAAAGYVGGERADGWALDAAAPGSAEQKYLPFWNTVLGARGKTSTETPVASGSITAIYQDNAAPLPNVPALSTAEKLDQAPRAVVSLQSSAQVALGKREPLDSQAVLSLKHGPASSSTQPPVPGQTISSPPKNTAPCLPSPTKRRRTQSPDRLPQNGHTERGASNAEHPCSHSFNAANTEKNPLNCDACNTGPHQHTHQCSNCKQNLCSACHSVFLQGQRSRATATTPVLAPGRKPRGRPPKHPPKCPPRRIATLSPPKAHSGNAPVAPRYACRHSYDHTATEPGQPLLVCTTCSNEVPSAFKCANCRSTLCRLCHHRFKHPRVRQNPPKPRLLAPAPLSPPPPGPPQAAPLPLPRILRRKERSSRRKPKPSLNGSSCRLPRDTSPPLAQLCDLIPAEPPPPKPPSYPQSPSPPPRTTEIHPPPPPTSTPSSDPPPLITASLQLLASKMPLQKYFSPEHVARRLRPMERGYWRIPTTAWGAGIKDQFWHFLEEYVGDGRAGWGVWVSRTVEAADGGAAATAVKVEAGQPGGDELVRFYCWGEVVGHVWLVMVIASERQVKGSGCCWVDGRDQVVIQMA
ncbi:MAG: hypothetical protein M1839_008363 [Geoglossum umbratile]|nr:MAG: hypothetical protein M1839_008363 [Geoglossum umbratile]